MAVIWFRQTMPWSKLANFNNLLWKSQWRTQPDIKVWRTARQLLLKAKVGNISSYTTYWNVCLTFGTTLQSSPAVKICRRFFNCLNLPDIIRTTNSSGIISSYIFRYKEFRFSYASSKTNAETIKSGDFPVLNSIIFQFTRLRLIFLIFSKRKC